MTNLRDGLITQTLPLPQPNLDNQAFYEATHRGELRFQRCSDCGSWRHYPRPACPKCQSREFRWELATGRGRVYSWTIVHGPTLPAFQEDLPYNVVDVLLEEGIHFQSQILDCPPEEIHEGMPLTAVFVPIDDEITLVKVRRAREGSR